FSLVIAVGRDRVVEIDHPVVVHCLQLGEHARRAEHVFLETNDYELRHGCSPFMLPSVDVFDQPRNLSARWPLVLTPISPNECHAAGSVTIGLYLLSTPCRKAVASTRPKSWMREAMTPVQPV